MTAPRRFQHPIDAPDPVAADYYRRFLRQGDPAPLREQAEHLAGALDRGDDLADAWIEHSRQLAREQTHAQLERAISQGVAAVPDAPAALTALFTQLERVPLWLDPACLDVGCRAFRRTGPLSGLVLSGFSLMGGYRSSAVVKTLMMTGKLAHTAGQRLIDTGRFVFAVTEPGALRRSGPGYSAAVHIRLLHAMVRYRLARSSKWRAGEWGLPINQADMLGTNLLFSMGFLIGCRELGLSFSEEESQGIIHLWRYVGYLLGLEESLLPATENEAARALYLVGASQPPADQDSLALARALHEVPLERAVTARQQRLAQIEMNVRTSVSRVLLGDRVADDLGLPKTRMTYGIKGGLVPLISGLDRLRALAPFGDELAFRLGDRWVRTAMATLEAGSAHAHSAAAPAR